MALMATIDRFEDNLAVFRFDDGQELAVPKSELPDVVREGARLVLTIVHTAEDEAKKADQARQLLNDLLQRKQ